MTVELAHSGYSSWKRRDFEPVNQAINDEFPISDRVIFKLFITGEPIEQIAYLTGETGDEVIQTLCIGAPRLEDRFGHDLHTLQAMFGD